MDSKEETEFSVGRFAFVMKAIAENDLWDEVVFQMEEQGLGKVRINSRQLAIVRAVLGDASDSSKALGRRGNRFLRCQCSDGGGPDAGPDAGPEGGADGGHHA